MSRSQFVPGATLLTFLMAVAGTGQAQESALNVKLTEWKVELSERRIPAGDVTFTVTNAGSIPHAFEVEGKGFEKETPLIQPGQSATLSLSLKPGRYEAYCPVGQDSHKHLGMESELEVVSGKGSAAIRATGGGPVIQILPGPFPFPDSAGPILAGFGEEHEALESQAENGPYSNNVAPIAGKFVITAWERGAVRDSVAGEAQFTSQDGARWRVVIDRVQTNDVPHHPKFGGVIEGLYYHGNTGVHTPLVPTINSAVALWAIAHLYKDDRLVTDNAMVHVMLLSRTRRDGDFALACWDCSKNKIEELQLQVTPAAGEAKFPAPGGFLFVNWERSGWEKVGG